MSSFGKRVDGPGGRRLLRRKRVGITASVVSCRSTSVLIENLSLTGAKLGGPDLLQGMTVRLKMGNRQVTGGIAWSAGNQSGLRFNFARR